MMFNFGKYWYDAKKGPAIIVAVLAAVLLGSSVIEFFKYGTHDNAYIVVSMISCAAIFFWRVYVIELRATEVLLHAIQSSDQGAVYRGLQVRARSLHDAFAIQTNLQNQMRQAELEEQEVPDELDVKYKEATVQVKHAKRLFWEAWRVSPNFSRDKRRDRYTAYLFDRDSPA